MKRTERREKSFYTNTSSATARAKATAERTTLVWCCFNHLMMSVSAVGVGTYKDSLRLRLQGVQWKENVLSTFPLFSESATINRSQLLAFPSKKSKSKTYL